MSPEYYDQQGRPMSFEEWVVAFEHVERRTVLATDLQAGQHLSTVWLGLNHGMPDGPLQIFETALFDVQGHAVEMWRWASREEAEKGHRELVYQLGGAA